MVRGMVYSLFILIYNSVPSISNQPCLTWDILEGRLKFICRVPDLSHQITLLDNRGQLYMNCNFNENAYNCTPTERKALIVTKDKLKYVIFTSGKLTMSMDGTWVCVQNNLRLTTNVSLSKGIIDSTEVRITGKFQNEKDNTIIIVTCFSCRAPAGNNVEFLENKRSVDSITFVNNTNKCTHHKGECHPNKCRCTRNVFMRAFQYHTTKNYSSYACEMMFTDSFTNQKFSKLATLFFHGEDFYATDTSTVIIKTGNKIWNGTLHTNITIATEMNQPRTTSVTETLINIKLETTDSLTPLQAIAIITGSVALCIFFLLLVRQHLKRSPISKKENVIDRIEMTEDFNLLQENVIDRIKRTEDSNLLQENVIDRIKMTEDSNLLQENVIDHIKMTEDSNLLQDNVIDCVKMTEDSNLLQDNIIDRIKMTEEKPAVIQLTESRNVATYLCDPCKNKYKSRSAIFLCIDCEESLCSICSHFHKVMKQTRTHNCVRINKIPRNFSLPLILCKDHGYLKYEYYCVDHEFLCCPKCITIFHSGKGCKVEVIDEVSNGFVKTQMFFDYEHQLEKYINLLVNLSTYQYHMIDQMADKKTDCETTALKLNAYATETCNIILSTREQQGLFEFMKDHGSERQLFILTNILKQSLIETDKRVLTLVENTKRVQGHYSNSQDDHGATFPSIEKTEKELMNISIIHRWRQSQIPVLGSRRK